MSASAQPNDTWRCHWLHNDEFGYRVVSADAKSSGSIFARSKRKWQETVLFAYAKCQCNAKLCIFAKFRYFLRFFGVLHVDGSKKLKVTIKFGAAQNLRTRTYVRPRIRLECFTSFSFFLRNFVSI